MTVNAMLLPLLMDNNLKLWVNEWFDAIRDTGVSMTAKITFVTTQW
jgi:hypothetical protein